MPPSSSIATISPTEGSSPARAHARQKERGSDALSEVALQDWIAVGYHGLVFVGVLLGQRNSDWPWAVGVSLSLWAAFVAGLLLVRGRFIPGPFWRALLYRVLLIGSVQASYALMRYLLPVINPRTLDFQLHQFDLDVFGIEPAVAFAPLVTRSLTEWFSFAYYGYFLLLLLHLAPMVFGNSNRRALGEFTLGLTAIFCTGQALYMLVPGYGPGVGLPHLFGHPLPIGFFGRLVNDTVDSWGAQKDIFPSIHTAVPIFLCLWSFRFRDARLFSTDGLLRAAYRKPLLVRLFRSTWLLTAAFSANVIVATMFLRWHYLVDVVAGVLLALAGFWCAIRLSPREFETRAKRGLGEIWPYFSKT